MGRLFGTDGIRGVAGRDLTGELAFALGARRGACARTAPRRRRTPGRRGTRHAGERRVPRGRPGRRDLLRGWRTCCWPGVQTTPAVAFLTTALGANAGAMISASHNPPEDNGIKFFSARRLQAARRARGRDGGRLARRLGRPPRGSASGRIRPIPDARERYIDHLVRRRRGTAVGHAGGRRLRERVGVRRGARGAAVAGRRGPRPGRPSPTGGTSTSASGAMHPEVVRGRGRAAWAPTPAWRTTATPTARCSPTRRATSSTATRCWRRAPSALRDAGGLPREHGRDDRHGEPRVPPGDGGGRASTSGSTKVGDRYVLEEMLRSGAVLGGEQSGHVIFSEHATTGDGVLTAIVFLSLAAKAGLTVADLAGAMHRYPAGAGRTWRCRDRAALDGRHGRGAAVRARRGRPRRPRPGAGPPIGHRAARPGHGRGRHRGRGARPRRRHRRGRPPNARAGRATCAAGLAAVRSRFRPLIESEQATGTMDRSCAASSVTWVPTRRFPS